MTRNQQVKKLFFQELARRNFWSFCLYMDQEFFKDRMFLKDIADGFQEIEEGKIKNQSIVTGKHNFLTC